MKNYIAKFILAFATILGVSCASFRANDLPVVPDSDYLTPKAAKIKVFSRWIYVTSADDAVLWAASFKVGLKKQ